MKLKRGSIVLATTAFLLTSLDPAPSVPSVPDPNLKPPTAEELTILSELADWVVGAAGSSFHALRGTHLGATIRERQRSFELFRRFNGKDQNRKFLDHLPYGEAIYTTAQRYRLDSLLLAAIVETESSFDPTAVSPQGAVGLMQVTPAIAELYGAADVSEPDVNLDLGARYFSTLLDRFHGDLELALAAYNAGPSRVERYGGVPPFRETKTYVDRVLARYIGHNQSVWQATGARELVAAR